MDGREGRGGAGAPGAGARDATGGADRARAPAAPRRGRRWPRRALVALGIVAALVLVVRLVVDPVATWGTRRALAALEDEGLVGTVGRVHVGFFPPSSVVTDLKLGARGAPAGQPPLLYVERATSRIAGLSGGALVVRQRVDGMKMSLVGRFDREAIARAERAARAVPGLLRRLPRARVERVDVARGELLVVDVDAPGRPRLWVHDLSMTARDLVTRPGIAGGRPMTASAEGRVQKSGRLVSRIEIPPGGAALTFDARTALVGLQTAELHALVGPRFGLHAPGGTISTFAAIAARDGRLSGTTRTVLEDVEVRATSDDVGDRVKAWIADKAVELASDEEEAQGRERERLTATVPIRGRIEEERPVWPQIVPVLRSSFSAALAQALPGGKDGREEGTQAAKGEESGQGDGARDDRAGRGRQGRRPAERR